MISDIHFQHPWLLLLLLIPLALTALYVYREISGRQPHLRVSTIEPWKKGGFPLIRIIRHIPAVLRILALCVLIIALARPRTPIHHTSDRTQGIDIMLALDVSGSMDTRDFDGGMSRVEALKMTAAEFVAGRPADRIGIVLFGAESYTQCPLTGNREAVISLIQAIQLGFIDEDGTAIGEGLATAVARIKDSEAESKVIILLTDGVNNSGNVSPMNAAELASNAGVKVYTIGMSGNFKPFNFGAQPGSLQQTFDEELLKNIADKTGGKYFKATDNTKFASIFAEINELDRSDLEREVSSWTSYREYFPQLGLLALILLLSEALLRLLLRRLP